MKNFLALLPLAILIGCTGSVHNESSQLDESNRIVITEREGVTVDNIRNYANYPVDFFYRDTEAFESFMKTVNDVAGIKTLRIDPEGYYGDANYSPYMPLAKFCAKEGVVLVKQSSSKGKETSELIESPDLTKCISARLNNEISSLDLIRFTDTYLYKFGRDEADIRELSKPYNAKKTMSHLEFLKLYEQYAIKEKQLEKDRLAIALEKL